MHLVFCFLGFLSMGLFERYKESIIEENQVFMTPFKQLKLVPIWFFLIGSIFPIIILFIYEKWYFAILYSILGIFVANVISEYSILVLNKMTLLLPIIISVLTLVGFGVTLLT